MLLAAQARGWQLRYVEQARSATARWRGRGQRAAADGSGPTRPTGTRSASRRSSRWATFDVILMRKDPPFDTEFIYTDLHPRARRAGGRAGRQSCPRPARHEREGLHGLVSAVLRADAGHARHGGDGGVRQRTHGKIVCKPLHSMGGHSIFVLEPGDKNSRVVFETLTQDGTDFAIVQKYLPDIVDGGDSRVLLIDGEPVPYALARIPSADRSSRQSRRRRQGRRPTAERARSLAVPADRPGAARGRHAVRRPGRHRRLRHRDQRHQPHRRTRARPSSSTSTSARCSSTRLRDACPQARERAAILPA